MQRALTELQPPHAAVLDHSCRGRAPALCDNIGRTVAVSAPEFWIRNTAQRAELIGDRCSGIRVSRGVTAEFLVNFKPLLPLKNICKRLGTSS